MKAAIFNPYLDTLGGGERYTAAIAKVLVGKGFRVDIAWKKKSIKKELEDRFGMDLTGVKTINDIKRGDGYDVCFWVSDGSIPLLRARKNILHFQFPFKNVDGSTLLNKMKLFRVNHVVCNSYFTKSFVDKEYGVESIVVYPPVDVDKIKPKKKENLILTIGRFSQLTQAKRQDILVESFKKFYDSGFKRWKMTLAGGVEVGVDGYVDNLEESFHGYPIKILKSPSLKEIINLYGRAKIFWSASGFGVDEKKEPKKVEHFGITIVEAMAAGVVPFAFRAGGHKEIIIHKENGYLWEDISELLSFTEDVVEGKGLLTKLSRKAKGAAKVYEYDRFEAEISKLL